MKIGIIVAMDKELKQLQTLFNDGNVRVEKCGIGTTEYGTKITWFLHALQHDD